MPIQEASGSCQRWQLKQQDQHCGAHSKTWRNSVSEGKADDGLVGP
jgi:hypothetical protein